MKRFSIIAPGIFIFLLFSCSGQEDFSLDGEDAYNQGRYNEAVTLFSKALALDSNSVEVREKLFLAYIYRGRELYQKTKNIKSFIGNYDKALEFFPSRQTASFKKEYSKLLAELAGAFLSGRAKNEVERDEFRTRAVRSLREALQLDSLNYAADSMLAGIKSENFQKILNTGKEYFKKGQRTRVIDEYFSAEHYLRRAAELDQDNAEINALLLKLKKIMLPVLNYREGVSIAVTKFGQKNNETTIALRIKNYLERPVTVTPEKFTLIDASGRSYRVDENIMKIKELYGEKILKSSVLNQEQPFADGVLGFAVPDTVKISYLNLRVDKKQVTRKYFP